MILSNEITCDTPSQHQILDDGDRMIIGKKFVHKHFERNVLVSSICTMPN